MLLQLRILAVTLAGWLAGWMLLFENVVEIQFGFLLLLPINIEQTWMAASKHITPLHCKQIPIAQANSIQQNTYIHVSVRLQMSTCIANIRSSAEFKL